MAKSNAHSAPVLHGGQEEYVKYGTLASLCIAFFAGGAATASAQYLDPDDDWTSSHSLQHAGAGAGLTVAMNALPNSWKHGWGDKAWKRGLVVLVIGTVYEVGQTTTARDANSTDGLPLAGHAGYGFSLMDVTLDMAGWAAGEGLFALGRKLLR